MSTFNIKIDGVKEFQRDLSGSWGRFDSVLRQAMVNSVNHIKNTAQKIVVYKTGTLRRSIYTHVRSSTYGEVNQDSNIASYGQVIEFGSKPHVIVPIRKKVLANSRTGQIFGRKVNHPGTRPQPYMKPAFEQSLNAVKDYFDSAVLHIVRRLGR